MEDGGPAFPFDWKDYQRGTGEQVVREQFRGMSLRDWFAGMALSQALQASASDGSYDYVAAAVGAYQLADAMLAERDK